MCENADEARSELIRLLDQDDWRFTCTALTQGLPAYQERFPERWATECELIRYIHDLLSEGTLLNLTLLGEPPGSMGVGWTMNNVDGQGLYIKLKIQDDLVIVLSFHKSKHFREE